MLVRDQLNLLGEVRDRKDAAAIFEIYKGLHLVRSTSENKGYPNQAAREAIVKIWQEPRMPKPRHTHNKPLDYPWSKAARDLYFAGSTTGTLVLEHVTPISHLRNNLFAAVSDPECTEHVFYDLLLKTQEYLNFAIITKAEDDIITAAGLRTALAAAGGDWGRYEQALNFTKDHFMAVTEDERYGSKSQESKVSEASNDQPAPALNPGDRVSYIGSATDMKAVEGVVSGAPDRHTGFIYVNVTEVFGGGCIVVPAKSLVVIG